MLTFSIHYTLDFASVFVHVSIYAASSAFHMATAQYVSAIILDLKAILQRCDRHTTTNDKNIQCLNSVGDVEISRSLNKTIAMHVDVLEWEFEFDLFLRVFFTFLTNSSSFFPVYQKHWSKSCRAFCSL